MEDKIEDIAEHASDWWYRRILKMNINSSFSAESTYEKLKQIKKTYKVIDGYKNFKEFLKLNIITELSGGESVTLETEEEAVGTLKEYVDSVYMNFRLPHDSIMHITEDGFTAVELGSFNRKVKTKYIPHENINKLMVRK